MAPHLLDVMCGAGGTSVGYARAGFDVTGLDVAPQPHYPFEFIRADAFEFLAAGGWRGFDALHASPSCPLHWAGNDVSAILLARDLMRRTGLPWVMEHSVGTQLAAPVLLCGTWFGLRAIRHRVFEASVPMREPVASCDHDDAGDGPLPCIELRIDWALDSETREATPPAYTQWIGSQLLAAIA